MKWTKIKTVHALYEYGDLTAYEFRAWIKIMCLTAVLEKEPTEAQILSVVRKNTLISLQNKLKTHSISIQNIVEKILEDVDSNQDKRQKSRATSKTYRDKNKKSDTSRDSQMTPLDKIRLDKIRKHTYAVDVTMTKKEHNDLVGKFGERGAKERIDRLSTYKQAKGVKYKSDYHTILMWEAKNKTPKKGSIEVW